LTISEFECYETITFFKLSMSPPFSPLRKLKNTLGFIIYKNILFYFIIRYTYIYIKFIFVLPFFKIHLQHYIDSIFFFRIMGHRILYLNYIFFLIVEH